MSIVEHVSSLELRDQLVASIGTLVGVLLVVAAFWAILPPITATACTVGAYAFLYCARTFTLLLSNAIANSRLIGLRDLSSIHMRFDAAASPADEATAAFVLSVADEMAVREATRTPLFESKPDPLQKMAGSITALAVELAAVVAAAAGGIWLREYAVSTILRFDAFVVGLIS